MLEIKHCISVYISRLSCSILCEIWQRVHVIEEVMAQSAQELHRQLCLFAEWIRNKAGTILSLEKF
jgi:hypothetical protein